ncbi:protein B4-like [Heptranchias perlo]|uniref:protein B4-like n=1 Tax=Heptranchias perlo TaxID=212740 RepID=UPI003559EF8C
MYPRKVSASAGSTAVGPRIVSLKNQRLSLSGVSRRTSTLSYSVYKHPPVIQMVVNALKRYNDRRGTSVPAIKKYITSVYPTVNPIYLRTTLKKALDRGLEKGVLVRPANSKAIGATGRFKLAVKKPLKAAENVDPNSDSTKETAANVKPKAKKPETDKKSDASKLKKSGALTKGKGEKSSGKGLEKSGLRIAKKSPIKTAKISKPEVKNKVDKKLGQASVTGTMEKTKKKSKAVKEQGSLSEAVPGKKASKGSPASGPAVKRALRGQGKKKNKELTKEEEPLPSSIKTESPGPTAKEARPKKLKG